MRALLPVLALGACSNPDVTGMYERTATSHGCATLVEQPPGPYRYLSVSERELAKTIYVVFDFCSDPRGSTCIPSAYDNAAHGLDERIDGGWTRRGSSELTTATLRGSTLVIEHTSYVLPGKTCSERERFTATKL